MYPKGNQPYEHEMTTYRPEMAWEVLDVVLVVVEVLVVAVVEETGGTGVVTGAKFAQNIMIQRDKMYSLYSYIMFM